NWIVGGNVGPIASENIIGFAAQQQVVRAVEGAHQAHGRGASLRVAEFRDPSAEIEPISCVLLGVAGSLHHAVQRHSCSCYDFPHFPFVGLLCSDSSRLCSVIVAGQTVPLLSSDLPPVNGRTSTE